MFLMREKVEEMLGGVRGRPVRKALKDYVSPQGWKKLDLGFFLNLTSLFINLPPVLPQREINK